MTTSHSFADMMKEEVTPLDLGEGSLDLSPNKEAGLNPEDFGMSCLLYTSDAADE